MSYAKRALKAGRGPDMGYLIGSHHTKMRLEDGVYVDVSHRTKWDNKMFLGFVIVQGGEVTESFSLLSNEGQTTLAERQAVQLALDHYPESKVYCDCLQVVEFKAFKEIGRVFHIPRGWNPAHDIAKRRRNRRDSIVSTSVSGTR